MKELEDYVNEKKETNKYLDDLSEFEGRESINKKERMSKKYKDKMAAEKEII
jgi:hypothetical protein